MCVVALSRVVTCAAALTVDHGVCNTCSHTSPTVGINYVGGAVVCYHKLW